MLDGRSAPVGGRWIASQSNALPVVALIRMSRRSGRSQVVEPGTREADRPRACRIERVEGFWRSGENRAGSALTVWGDAKRSTTCCR